MAIKVRGPRILVRPEKLEDSDPVYKAAKAAGIHVEKSGEVLREEQSVSVGRLLQTTPQCWQAPVGDGTPWGEVGDLIFFAKYAGRYQKDPETDELLLVLNDEDMLGVLEGAK